MAIRGSPSVTDAGFFAEYPFLPGAEGLAGELADSMRTLLESPTLERARELGRARIRSAVDDPLGHRGLEELERADPGERFLSFQYARLLLGAAKSPAPLRRWAVAEAKRAGGRLERAPTEELLSVAHRLELEFAERGEAIGIPVPDYVRLATPIREAEFRLARQNVDGGEVRVGRERAARLLQEGIRRRLSLGVPIDEEVRAALRRSESELLEDVDRRVPAPVARPNFAGTALQAEAFPPCVRKMRLTLQQGENLSHAGRFALAAFLHKIGADAETIVNDYRGAPDFDEGITRYQVEHITHHGGGEGYDPPTCDTLRSHGLCAREGDPASADPVLRSRDARCFDPGLKHPLQYYRGRARPSPAAGAVASPGTSPEPGRTPSTDRRG